MQSFVERSLLEVEPLLARYVNKCVFIFTHKEMRTNVCLRRDYLHCTYVMFLHRNGGPIILAQIEVFTLNMQFINNVSLKNRHNSCILSLHNPFTVTLYLT